ncbi:hypothetical protein [Bacillus sp. 2205SS5-2]|uniref:hypothetical protein n=1 Tax=Bacillus sp. 2205SS5-2 TaxID=3109031 RepID=UPI003004CBA9
MYKKTETLSIVEVRAVEEIVRILYKDYPELHERHGEKGKKHTVYDLKKHFEYIDAAFKLESSQVFLDYIYWLYNVLSARGMENTKYLLATFRIMKEQEFPTWSHERFKFYQAVLTDTIGWIQSQPKKDHE